MWQSLVIWYENLSTTSQWCLCSLLAVSIIGFFRLLFLIYKEWHADPRLIKNYIEIVVSFADKYQKGIDNSVEIIYILRKSEKVSDLLAESFPDSPVSELAAKIKYSNVISYQALATLKQRIFANCLKWDEKRKTKKWVLLIQLLLPIVFWPFRGVEALLLLLSYLFKMIGLGGMDTKGKLAVALASIGGIVGFIGSLASILSFMGVNVK